MLNIYKRLIISSILSVSLLCSISITFPLQISHTQAQMTKEPWTKGAPMPTPRTEVTAVELENSIYVIGGFDADGKPTGIVEAYNIKNNTWTTNIKSLPIPLHHAAAVSDGGKIYVAGGYFGEWKTSDRLFIYDTIDNDWKEGKPMPTQGALQMRTL